MIRLESVKNIFFNNLNSFIFFEFCNQSLPKTKKGKYAHAFKLFSNQKSLNCKPMVFIEGIFGRLGTSENTINHIHKRKVYSIQIMNHYDKSRYSDVMNYDMVIEDINNIVQYIGLKEFSLLGNCLGSRIATEYAVRYPHKIDHLILWQPPGNDYYCRYQFLIKAIKKIEQINPNKRQFRQRVKSILPNKQQDIYNLSSHIQFLLHALKQYDKQGNMKWKVNMDAILRSQHNFGKESSVPFLKNVHIMTSQNSPRDYEQYLIKKFPNFDLKEIKEISNTDHFSLSYPNQGRILANHINNIFEKYDAQQYSINI